MRTLHPGQLRLKLCKETKLSKGKFFFILRQRPNHKKHTWHLVQVEDDETNWIKAKREGIYHVRYYIRSYADSKKFKGRECAYWP